MSMILTNSQNYTSIASAIRSKKNVTTAYTPSQMATAILSIPNIDTSGDTVVPEKLAYGYTAHNSDGLPITGTMKVISDDGLSWVDLSECKWESLVNLTWNDLSISSVGIDDVFYKVELSPLLSGNYQLTITDAQTPVVLDTTKPVEKITYNGTEFTLVSPRRNVFSLAFCQFEPDITSHVDIDRYGSTFTIRRGSTTGNSVYFMLDPDVTYNLSWTSQNCSLVGYSDSWDTVIDESSGDGLHTISNATNVHYCYFMVLNASTSLTGTFQDVVITEV